MKACYMYMHSLAQTFGLIKSQTQLIKPHQVSFIAQFGENLLVSFWRHINQRPSSKNDLKFGTGLVKSGTAGVGESAGFGDTGNDGW